MKRLKHLLVRVGWRRVALPLEMSVAMRLLPGSRNLAMEALLLLDRDGRVQTHGNESNLRMRPLPSLQEEID